MFAVQNTPSTVSWQEQIEEGQAVYSRKVLRFYDFWVLGFSNTLLWRCPTKLLRQKFRLWASPCHLDIGVGTAYYLAKCLGPEQQRLALLDLNPNSLAYAAERVKHLKPEVYCADILVKELEPQDFNGQSFDSISMNYLLHCLPGNMQQKAMAFRNVAALLSENGRIFGSTILGANVVKLNRSATWLMNLYNRKGIFHNQQDSLETLLVALEEHFRAVEVSLHGCVAVFTAQKKRSSALG